MTMREVCEVYERGIWENLSPSTRYMTTPPTSKCTSYSPGECYHIKLNIAACLQSHKKVIQNNPAWKYKGVSSPMLALEQPQSKLNLWSLATMSTEEKCCLYRKSCWYTTNLLLLQCYSVTPAHLLLVGNLSSVCSCSCCISKCLWIDSCNFLICPLLAWRHFQAVCVFSSSAKAQYRQLANIRWISQWL